MKQLTVEEAEAKAKAWFLKKKPMIQAHDPRRMRIMRMEEESIAIQSYAAGLRQEGEEDPAPPVNMEARQIVLDIGAYNASGAPAHLENIQAKVEGTVVTITADAQIDDRPVAIEQTYVLTDPRSWYTVVVNYQNPDDYRDTNNYTTEVQATSADEAGAVAVDSLITEIHEPDDDDLMDPTKWMDNLRTDYKCIAIFKGRLVNQVKPQDEEKTYEED